MSIIQRLKDGLNSVHTKRIFMSNCIQKHLGKCTLAFWHLSFLNHHMKFEQNIEHIEMGLSENVVCLNPMVFMISFPLLNGYFIGNINPTFSDTYRNWFMTKLTPQKRKVRHFHGSLNVPIEHHPTIRYMVYNGYYKVMSFIFPSHGTFTNPWFPHNSSPSGSRPINAGKPEANPKIRSSVVLKFTWKAGLSKLDPPWD